MGQKMVCFGSLRLTRSRQDESIEVGEVGSKRPSLGCNGVHVVRCSGLIFWLLKLKRASHAFLSADDESTLCAEALLPFVPQRVVGCH